jgi:hypothetical protein
LIRCAGLDGIQPFRWTVWGVPTIEFRWWEKGAAEH